MFGTRYPSYDSREDERPVRLDRTEGVVIIEGRPYPAREVIEALAQSGYAQIRTVGNALVLGHRKIAPIFKSRQERALASLCHGSLAYCCPLSKRCPERDRALEVLGLTPEDYERLKMEEHHQFLDAAGSHDPLTRYADEYGHSASPRAANRPAIDAGFGGDDYRRDFDALERAMRERDLRRGTDRASTVGWGVQTHSGSGIASEQASSPGPDVRGTRAPVSTSSSGRQRSPFGRTASSPATDSRTGTGALTSQTPVAAPSAAACSLGSEEIVGGLGALFRQGEISPFADERTRGDESHSRSFCFSCGKTIGRGTVRCPYCGAIQ